MNKKLIIMLSVAVIAAMVLTAFPLHIEPRHNSDWPFVITIGSPVSAQEADYTCDGADDDVQFQAALDALPGAGGQLFVLAGNYTFANNTTVTRAIDHVSIIGVSAAVSFTGDGVTAIFTAGGDGWLFSNIEADAGGLAMGATTDYMWLHVIVDSTYYPLKTDAINIEDHSALHGVSGADTIFPADPDADKYLFWDDDPGELVWSDAGAGDGDMQKATYDTDEDGDIDTAAGGTEWDSSAATGVAYITAGAWGTRATGISNTYIVIVDDADAANGDIPYFTTSGLAGYNEAEFKSAYNMEAGTDYQAYDAELAAVAGLTSAANKMIYFTGSGTADVADLTAFARSILDDTDEATFKATVNLEIGTDVQAQDAELAALAGLTSAADKLPYFTGSGTADVTGLSAFTRGFLDDVDEATFKATVNLEIGTDVLAYDATLSSIADLGTAADKIAYTTDVDTWAETGLTAFARSILDDVDEATFKATVNLEIGTDVLAQQTIGIADDNLLEVDDADAADDDYAKFTANGLEGRSYSEVRSDLNVEDGADVTPATEVNTRAYLSSEPQAIPSGSWTRMMLDGESFDIGSDFDVYTLTDQAEAGTDTNTLVCAGALGDVIVGDWIWNKNDDTYHIVTDISGAPNSVEYSDVAAGELANGDDFKIYRCTFTAPETGYYMAGGGVYYNTVTADHYVSFGARDDTTYFILGRYHTSHDGSAVSSANGVSTVYLEVGSVVDFMAYQDSGAAIDINNTPGVTWGFIYQIA